jgi:hypothetical protein
VVLSLFKSRPEPPLSGAEKLAGIACVGVMAFYCLFFFVMRRLSYGIQLQFQDQRAKALTDGLRRKPYALGSTIRFCSGCTGFDRIGLLAGWSYPEPWGTWTEGPQAKFILQLSLPIRAELQLVGRMVAITDGRQPQQVDVVINGEKVERWTLDASGVNERRALIPPIIAALRQPMLVRFDILHPVAPSTVSFSDDQRLLGIGMEELRIYEKDRTQKP